ncbi:aminopeptidase [Thermoflexibacter ruber]|uniref:Predicted aminopeptidase n=1 Tax=Thermoflexibacter ruber TaxID=1003 RepID=A0A1I2E9W7_9BACT|nr:aminopeptidase [Thermoflexibacter ruber]SFE89050.1 Predicted aminopeptidase [Thermoflexibacter ruber]
MRKLIKRILLIFLLLLLFLCIWQFEIISYGLMQAKGQFTILLKARPIREVLEDKSIPDSVKSKLHLIQEIKQFAIDSLGLSPSGSYEKFYDQQDKPILWTITACEPYSLTAKEWFFPFVGTFSYKGFFDKGKLKKEEERLKKQGWDTEIDEVSAWSTLGYFDDPILSSMLMRSEGSLANLIIHELTHGTLFINDNLTYNENLANFVGNQGAILFLQFKYGENSLPLEKYLAQQQDREKLNAFLLSATQKLDSLYRSFDKKTSLEQKQTQKEKMIQHIISSVDTIAFRGETYKDYFKDYTPNNAFFVGFLTYNEKQNTFEQEFKNQFNGDFKKYFAYLREKYAQN